MLPQHIYSIITRWRSGLIKSLQLQLCISLISLPFLVSWGIPISIMTLFSTLLFGPFLTLFLLISSIIFFCELIHLPHSLFDTLLECITSTWLFFLNISQQSWLIGFTKPPLIALLLIIPCTLAIMHHKNNVTAQSRVTQLFMLFIAICCIMKLFPYQYNAVETITSHNKTLYLINHDNKLALIDNGVFSARLSSESFITYTLIPEIIKKTGKMHINHLIVHKVNKRTFDAIAFLSTKMHIKHVYVPWWMGKISSSAWASYVKLKKSLSLSNGKIISLSNKRPLLKTINSSLFIEPNNTHILKYHDATYPPLSITGIIDTQPIQLPK